MSFNKVILVGNLGKDPLNLTKGETAIAAFSLATHETTSFNGKTERTTEWFDVVCFGRDADFVLKYLTKGNEVLVEGRLQARTYTTKEGTKVKAFEIRANTVQGLSRTPSKSSASIVVNNSIESSSDTNSRDGREIDTSGFKTSSEARNVLSEVIGEETLP